MESLELVFLALTLVAIVALAVWVGRKIRPDGGATRTDSATEQARGHAVGHSNHIGGSGS